MVEDQYQYAIVNDWVLSLREKLETEKPCACDKREKE
jgi:hypothetical protein